MNNLGFGSVALILIGAFVAGAHDMSFDTYGYLVVVVANISTAMYLTTIARIGAASSFLVISPCVFRCSASLFADTMFTQHREI